MSRHATTLALRLVCGGMLLAVAASPAAAAGRAHPRTAISPAVLELPTAFAGLRVAIDPITGTLSMPAPEPAGAAALAARPDRANMPVRVLADGTKVVDLDERFMEFAVVRIAPDGAREMTCVDGLEAAEAQAAAPAPKPSATPRPAGKAVPR